MDYRTQRLKEDLTNAQQRNKKQRIQLANYKKCHERDLETIKKQKEIINKATEYIKERFYFNEETGEYSLLHTFDKCNAKELLDILNEVSE